MKIESIVIVNFKAFGPEPMFLSFNNLTALIGENSVGKSNILEALDLFFNFSKTKVSIKSFHQDKYLIPIKIEVKFCNLCESELGVFKTHLDDDNKLTITQIIQAISTEEDIAVENASEEEIDFNESKHGTKLEPTQEYLWTKIEDKLPTKTNIKAWWRNELKVGDFDFKSLFESTEEPSPELFQEKLIILNERYYTEIPHSRITGDEKVLGWKNKLKGNLPKYFFIPAIKSLSDDLKITKTSALGELINWISSSVSKEIKEEFRAKSKVLVDDLLDKIDKDEAGRSKIGTINMALNANIGVDIGCTLELKFGTPEIQDIVFPQPKIFADDGYYSELTDKGHGIQRLAIFSLLRTYNTFDFGKKNAIRNIILGIEEPEIYLHPPLKRSTYSLLRKISEGPDQVIYSTHDSLFISVEYFDEIRLFRKSNEEMPVTGCFELPINQIINFYNKFYGIVVEEKSVRHRFRHLIDETKNEGFFAKKIILIEGETEKYALPNYFLAIGFDLDANRVSLINAGSVDTITYLLLLFNEFRIPCYVIFDGDKPSVDLESLVGDQRKDAINKSRRNKEIFKLLGNMVDDEMFFFPSTTIADNYAVWERNFEETFHKGLANYYEIKSGAKELYCSDSKPLTARYFSEIISKSPDKIDGKISEILEKVKKLEWKNSIIESENP